MIRKVYCGGIRSIDDKKFTAEVVMSDETLDRYDEVIRITAYQNTIKQFKKHAVLLSSHKYSDNLKAQIGEWEDVWIEGKKLIGRAKWYVGEGNSEADWGFKLAQKGIAAFSVGFRAIKVTQTDWEKYQEAKKAGKAIARLFYDEVDLVETSQVLVPANPTALQRSLEEDTVESKYFNEHIDVIKTLEHTEEATIPEKFMLKGNDESEVVEYQTPSNEESTSKEIIATFVKGPALVTEETFVKALQDMMAKFSEIEAIVTKSDETFEEFSTFVKGKLEDISTEQTVKIVLPVPDNNYIDNLLKAEDDIDDSSKNVGIDLTELKASIEGLTTTIQNMKVEVK